ncbi:MAG: TIGR00730 family Rossman fold protein [Verrucomicrobiaceae bacterium]|nr:TIGR00730 family Rossman fold protein [Verrucomicrobiaceae bacterium]
MKSICVYCGSSPGSNSAFAEAAKQTGRTLAQRGIRVIYGGGNVGLMGRLADGALEAGGEVIGVIPHHLADKELAHPGASQMIRVATMHERKQTMADLSDAFIALPGGIGTLEELFETLTWLQLGLHNKPVGLLNVHHFWDRMLDFLDQMVVTRFLKPLHRDMLIVSSKLPDLLTHLQDFNAPDAGKWLDTAHTDLR